jgi:ubiquinone/menaquinone biosynthesis C-methylase UbiE
MTRLSDREFKAMNNRVRRWYQRRVEFPAFRRMGMDCKEKDVVELGCGSGYGAVLLMTQHPRSYIGMDIMPEQISLAKGRDLTGTEFLVPDVAHLDNIRSDSKDMVVVFGILHHVPEWREALVESHRILKRGGEIYLEEPDGRIIRATERLFPFGHEEVALFTLKEFEGSLVAAGFEVLGRRRLFGFGLFRGRKP